MNNIELSLAERIHRFFSRPAGIVKVVCLMLIGLGVAVALIAKVYMIVLTDHQCATDSVSLGNKVLCINSLELVAYALGIVAGFEFAHRLFSNGISHAIEPLILGVCSALLLMISALKLENASWELAMVLTSLTLCIGALLYFRERFLGVGNLTASRENPHPSDESNNA